MYLNLTVLKNIPELEGNIYNLDYWKDMPIGVYIIYESNNNMWIGVWDKETPGGVPCTPALIIISKDQASAIQAHALQEDELIQQEKAKAIEASMVQVQQHYQAELDKQLATVSNNSTGISEGALLKALAIAQDPKLALELVE